MSVASTGEPFVFNPDSGGGATGVQTEQHGFATSSAGSNDAAAVPQLANGRKTRPGGKPDGGSSDSAGQMVQQARQEISQIVREVAMAGKRPRDHRTEYLRFLADRIMRAMAAYGVVIWNLETDARVEFRLGEITDRSIDKESQAAHDRLIVEVASDNAPVVVPPTPGATDPDVPANPTDYPAAMVPIILDQSQSKAHGIIQVFLQPGGTPASQRGCLRFLAQMADLAGEYLRSDQMRMLRRHLDLIQGCDREIEHMQAITSTRKIETAWVDAIADQLHCQRVALCRIDQATPKLIAVSHVETIDQNSEAAQQLRDAAEIPMTQQGQVCLGIVSNEETATTESEVSDAGERRKADRRAKSQISQLVCCSADDSRWRLLITVDGVMRQKIENESPDVILGLRRLLVGGELAWDAARRIEVIPGGKFWTRLSQDDEPARIARQPGMKPRSRRSPLRRRLSLAAGVGLATVLILALPIPVLVPAKGVIRPLELDTYHAPLDAVVDEIQVAHGQEVRRGDVLVSLVSRDLDERKSNLLGRRGVVIQRRRAWEQSLAGNDRTSESDLNQFGGQEFDEEIASIDEQLGIIEANQKDLTIQARRDGIVDAWRLQERLASRPMRRGDAIISIVAKDTTWVVDARVRQQRIEAVSNCVAQKTLKTVVSPHWAPEDVLSAKPQRFGPLVSDPVDGSTGVVLRMILDKPPRIGDQTLVEMPARLSLNCGRVCLGRFLTEDIVDWMQQSWSAYR